MIELDYAGVAELGLIAGTGMLISFVATVGLLPALLSLRPFRLPEPGSKRLARSTDRSRPRPSPMAWLDKAVSRWWRPILAVALVLSAGVLTPDPVEAGGTSVVSAVRAKQVVAETAMRRADQQIKDLQKQIDNQLLRIEELEGSIDEVEIIQRQNERLINPVDFIDEAAGQGRHRRER